MTLDHQLRVRFLPGQPMRPMKPPNEALELLKEGLREEFGEPAFCSRTYFIYHVTGCHGVGVTAHRNTVEVCIATHGGDERREQWISRSEWIVCTANIHEPDSIPRIKIGIKEAKRKILEGDWDLG